MDISRNVNLYYAIKFFYNMIILVPVMTIFFFANGLTMAQVMLLESIFSIGLIVFQVPTGALADIIGRKGCMILGSFVIAFSSILYGFGTGFWQFAIAELVWAFGAAAVSGADVALIYDTLKQSKNTKLSTHILGDAFFYSLLGGVLSSLASGYITATLGFRGGWYITTVTIAVSGILGFWLIEPKQKVAKLGISTYYSQMIDSIKLVLQDKRLALIMVNSALVGCLGVIGFWFYQPHMKASGIPIELFGFIFAGVNIFAAISSKFAHYIEKILDVRKIVWISPFLTSLAFIGLALFFNPIASILLIIMLQFVRGFSNPTFATLQNNLMPSEKRATMFSFGGMLSRIFFVILAPIFGYLSDSISMSFALLMVAMVAAIQIPLFGIKQEKVSN
jgi:MFS family permease